MRLMSLKSGSLAESTSLQCATMRFNADDRQSQWFCLGLRWNACLVTHSVVVAVVVVGFWS